MKIIPQERYYKEGLELIKFAEIELGDFQKSFEDKFAGDFGKAK